MVRVMNDILEYRVNVREYNVGLGRSNYNLMAMYNRVSDR